jgi:hypothetical protein
MRAYWSSSTIKLMVYTAVVISCIGYYVYTQLMH